MTSDLILPILAFSGSLIFSQLSPGPDQTLVVRSSLLYGFRAGATVTLGISVGIIAHAILAITVGTALMQSAWSGLFFGLAGCWLIYLAWKIWPKTAVINQGLDAVAYADKPRRGELFKDALLCNLLNPKCTLFLVSLSAPLLAKNTGIGFSLFFIVLTFIVGGLSWIIWVIAFQWKPIRRFYTAHMVAIDRIFSIILFVFGSLLLASVFR